MSNAAKPECRLCRHFRDVGYVAWGECDYPLPPWAGEQREGWHGTVAKGKAQYFRDYADQCEVYETRAVEEAPR